MVRNRLGLGVSSLSHLYASDVSEAELATSSVMSTDAVCAVEVSMGNTAAARTDAVACCYYSTILIYMP